MSNLKNVEEFNFNGNPVEDLLNAVDSLKTLPSLHVLQINLHEEEQVDYLLRTLTDLEYLNGLAVEREALFNEDEEDDEEEEGDEQQQQHDDDGNEYQLEHFSNGDELN